jgi:hypothetical protein
MKKLTLALAIAAIAAIASPVFAQTWNQFQLNDIDQQLRQQQYNESVRRSLDMANDAIRQQQETVNRGLSQMNQPSIFCLRWQRAQGMC